MWQHTAHILSTTARQTNTVTTIILFSRTFEDTESPLDIFRRMILIYKAVHTFIQKVMLYTLVRVDFLFI